MLEMEEDPILGRTSFMLDTDEPLTNFRLDKDDVLRLLQANFLFYGRNSGSAVIQLHQVQLFS